MIFVTYLITEYHSKIVIIIVVIIVIIIIIWKILLKENQ